MEMDVIFMNYISLLGWNNKIDIEWVAETMGISAHSFGESNIKVGPADSVPTEKSLILMYQKFK